MTFLIIALAGPKIGTEVREVKQRGVDMLITLDVSASMNAEDVRPSRLEKLNLKLIVSSNDSMAIESGSSSLQGKLFHKVQ